MTFTIAKINKRMHIIDASGKSVYTPPSFVLMRQRSDLQEVADKFNNTGYDIQAIIEFESDKRFRKDLKW